MQGVDHYEDFTAICDHMPGKAPTLRVSGTVWTSTDSWTCKLRATPGNTGSNQRMLSLDLVLTAPTGVANEVIVPNPVEWSEQPAYEYDQVHFRVVGTDDRPPDTIDVVHPTRAEASAS
jgi:hypothetical protein